MSTGGMRKFDFFQLIIALVGLGVFVLLMLGVLFHLPYIHLIDNFGLHVIREPVTPERTWFFKNITRAGNTAWTFLVMLMAVIIAVAVKKFDIAVFMFVNVGIFALGSMAGLKHIFSRPRPSIEHLIHVTGYSFPSGHALNSILLYGSLIVLVHYYVTNLYLRYAFMTLLATLIIAIPLSRVYLGVHYLTDVMAGFSLGLFCLIMSKELIFKYRTRELFEHEENA
ncbi:MAG: phosphatase PAP2 family protein [Lactobacillaceae bacterium]|jgi:undecaprenyl-diphosphatase|nr:phosphatase PAP2 family protein [Lactobacillaceae bacterium]